ncbi:MAG: Gfo/Idh/MocA family oxidoreductase [Verrucomicrobiota bacterium]
MKCNTPYSTISRRHFLYTSGLTLASSALSAEKIIGANERIRVGFVGMGSRSAVLLKQFLNIPNVEVVAICDPDTAQMQEQMGVINKSITEAKNRNFTSTSVDTIQDYRKLYERSDIDAVIISSPNHWHTLQAIHAVQAGKHVYLEKPLSFTPWEGHQLQAATERYGKIIAPGFQNRSDPGPQNGIQFVQDGNLGKILKVRSLCYRNRDSIGSPLAQPLKIPSTMDFDLWLGPAQEQPIMRPKIHYDWHWDFNTGNGDMGNQGVHETDMVYWLLGHPGLPEQINCFGNRFAWNDAGNTPNMFTIWCKWGGVEVILETNDVKLGPDRNASSIRMGTRVGIVAECEGGFLKGGRGGMVAVEPDEKTIIRRFKGDGGKSHQQSFIEAVRNNDSSTLPTTVAKSTPAEAVMHFGNAAYRTGTLTDESTLKSSVQGNEDLMEILSDQSEQLKAWGINKPQYFAGKTVHLNTETGEVLKPLMGKELIGPNYRKGFEVPKLV